MVTGYFTLFSLFCLCTDMISYHYGFMAYTLTKGDGFKEYKKRLHYRDKHFMSTIKVMHLPVDKTTSYSNG